MCSGVGILPKADEVVIPIEKFTKYALNAMNSEGKSDAFELALGYNLSNVADLIGNIKMNLKNFPAKHQGNKGFGEIYSVLMVLVGANGKSAHVMTAWIDDAKTDEMRLTSAYVKKRRE